VLSAAFSADGKRASSIPQPKTCLWDATTGELLAIFPGIVGSSVTSAEFSPDGRSVVTVEGDGKADSGIRRQQSFGSYSRGRSTAFSPDGTRVVTASEDGTALGMDTATGALIVTLRGHSGPVWSAAFSPDGKRIVTASEDGYMRIGQQQWSELDAR
jgi:WD40 repeat protein